MNPPNDVLRWEALCEKWAAAYPNLVPHEILALIWTESSGNPDAINESDPSYGLCQVTMLIAKAYGNVVTIKALYDPDNNVRCASNFLSFLKRRYAEQFPNYRWVSGYNQGEGNLLKGYLDSPYVNAYLSHLQALSS